MSPLKRAWQFIGWLLSQPVFWLIRVTYKSSRRVRVAVIVDGDILTLRNWMGDRNWRLPGGGIKTSEEPKNAAIRELAEELALELSDEQLISAGSAPVRESGVDFIAEYFVVRLDARPDLKLRTLEVMSVNWQSLKGDLNKVLIEQLKAMKIID